MVLNAVCVVANVFAAALAILQTNEYLLKAPVAGVDSLVAVLGVAVVDSEMEGWDWDCHI